MQLARLLRWGNPEERKAAAFVMRQRAHGLISVSRRGGGAKTAAHMRLAKAAKKEEKAWQAAAAERDKIKKQAMITYSRLGPGSTSFRPNGKCACAGCTCEGSLPGHFCRCVKVGCACNGSLHALASK